MSFNSLNGSSFFKIINVDRRELFEGGEIDRE